MRFTSRRVIAVVITVIVLLSLVFSAGCSKNSGSSEKKFSYWIATGQDASYYSDYRQNPAVEYLLDYTEYENKNGKFKIDLEFMVPVAGSEVDNFNTLLSTGEYADIMDMSRFQGSIVELYEDGVIVDLTEYMEEYMPNYMAYLEANPELTRTATNLIDGEKKYLQLYNYNNSVMDEYWSGYNYRRDWLVKYGEHPVDGSKFSGEYTKTNEDGTPDVTSWVDNVVFPSGGYHPIYISDWEWMFEIFSKAIADQSIEDGYCLSLYYPGYMETGEIVSSFGGGGAHWYQNKDGSIEFGADSEDFRTYLQAMNTWYKNGWIDTAFPEHSTDLFYRIDDAKVRQGKVGLWLGSFSQLMGNLDDPNEPLLDGMIVFTAAYPINDIYGSADQQNVEPYNMYQPSLEGPSITITDKAAEKDLPALLTFLDQMYTEEYSYLKRIGLNEEQYNETKNEVYTKNGLTEGAYYWLETEDGKKWQYHEALIKDGGTLQNAVRAVRIFGNMPGGWAGRDPLVQDLINQWDIHKATGRLPQSFVSQLSAEDAKEFSKIETQVREFLSKNVPGFIQGDKDPFNDEDWNAFTNALSKYGPARNVEIYQNLLDQLQ